MSFLFIHVVGCLDSTPQDWPPSPSPFCARAAGGNCISLQDCLESILQTPAWEAATWQDLFGGKEMAAPGFPMSYLHLSGHGKTQFCLH